MTGIVLSKDSHGDSVKNTGDEGLQKLGQEARSQAPSFSEVSFYDELLEDHFKLIELQEQGYKLPEVSGRRMARKV